MRRHHRWTYYFGCWWFGCHAMGSILWCARPRPPPLLRFCTHGPCVCCKHKIKQLDPLSAHWLPVNNANTANSRNGFAFACKCFMILLEFGECISYIIRIQFSAWATMQCGYKELETSAPRSCACILEKFPAAMSKECIRFPIETLHGKSKTFCG